MDSCPAARCQTTARDRYARCFGSDLFGRALEASPRRIPDYARRVDIPTDERSVVPEGGLAR